MTLVKSMCSDSLNFAHNRNADVQWHRPLLESKRDVAMSGSAKATGFNKVEAPHIPKTVRLEGDDPCSAVEELYIMCSRTPCPGCGLRHDTKLTDSG